MHGIDRLLVELRHAGERPCIFERGEWITAAALTRTVEDWRRELGRNLPRRGAVLGLRATFSRDAIACLLAAWAERALVALLPPGAETGDLIARAGVEQTLTLTRGERPAWHSTGFASNAPLLTQLRVEQDAGLLIFTSGSTGRPKIAVHSLARFLLKFAARGRSVRTLAMLQFDHVAGIDALLYTLHAGGALVLPDERTPASVCAAIESARVEVLSTAPSFLRLLSLSGSADGADLSSVRTVTYGAEPMDPATLARVQAIFPGARISQKYGTTELGAPRTRSEANDSLWLRFDGGGTEAQVRDGMLWLRSESRFLGYLDDPDAVDAAGWMNTGDRVEVRGEWLRILGRDSDVISVGGEKVTPAEVEAAILELDEVIAAAVRGEPNPLLGQIVVARVQLLPGTDEAGAEKRIRRHCRAKLAPYQVPVSVEVATEPLVTDRQKVRRRDVS